MIKPVFYLLFFCLTIISGCSSVDGVGRYRIEKIGNHLRKVDAVVLSTRSSFIQQISSGNGSLIGGIVGGSSALDSNNPAIIIAGIVGGIVIGGAIEGYSNIFEATEYLIQTKNKNVLTVVQVNNNNELFKPGDNVILMYGYPNFLVRSSNDQ